MVSFTGSAATAMKLQTHPVIARESVRFVAERDSLNASVLGPDAAPGTPEFDLFVREVAIEMTVKAGQKCTAIRRALAPAEHMDALQEALSARLASTNVGDPRDEATRMGALVSTAQRDDVRARIAELAAGGARSSPATPNADPGPAGGAFLSPILLRSDDPWSNDAVHDVEAFGPVSTIMPYRDLADAVALGQSRQGQPRFVAVHPRSRDRARLRARRGRLSRADADHRPHQRQGIDRPRLAAAGPHPRRPRPRRRRRGDGRDARRQALHAAHRDPVVPGDHRRDRRHLHQRRAQDRGRRSIPSASASPSSKVGETLKTASRTVTLDDIEHFAAFTGDNFYAHMDEEAAKANPIFDGRVAHGYLILSFAAGLFVDPAPGPVLANTGLENLRFLTPLYPGNSMRVELTVRSMTLKDEETGQVRWAVEVFNQKDELVATYDLLTMNTP